MACCAQGLPGGYDFSERPYYTYTSETVANQPTRLVDDSVQPVYGQQVEIQGASRGFLGGKGLVVKFPGDTDSLSVPLTFLSRTPPVRLPRFARGGG